ncbi:hypothetical protein ACSVHC_18115 [Arthrobacter sp. KNU-44]|uniref:hypothetical protein n=1 Tax=Arthrobacter sp. KNU-44 TaxID=3450744 RepID=UPI003F421504
MALSEGIIGPVATSRPNVPTIYWVNPDTFPFWEGAEDLRLPTNVPFVPTPRTDCIQNFMTLTSPITGLQVTFLKGETLPAWALPFR